MIIQVHIQDLCKGGGGKQDFADIAWQSRSGSKNLGLKIGGQGRRRGPAPTPPPPPDPHLILNIVLNFGQKWHKCKS